MRRVSACTVLSCSSAIWNWSSRRVMRVREVSCSPAGWVVTGVGAVCHAGAFAVLAVVRGVVVIIVLVLVLAQNTVARVSGSKLLIRYC
jgi:hypothetical protein